MKQGSLLIDTKRRHKPTPVPVPTLLVTLEPRRKVFFRNLADLFWPRRKVPLELVSRPASFWTDVFVPTRLPWSRFLQSGLAHVAVIAALWGWSQLWPQRPRIVERPVFHSSDVVYYDASEYVAPLDTVTTSAQVQEKGEPAYAPQPIISVPPEADNRKQTIVTPPPLKLNQDVPLPNVVALGQPKPTIPLATVAGSPSDLKLPVLSTPVVAPAPEVDRAVSNRDIRAPQAAIVEPPSEIGQADSRRLTDINIGPSQVVAPAPQLPVAEQRWLPNVAPMESAGPAVVPPPPSVQGSGTSGDGRLIALNLHPVAPSGPVEVPAGNRRGTFEATPDGKPGAAGTPSVVADNQRPGQGGTGSGSSTNGVPPGLFVGRGSKPEVNSAIGGGQGTSAAKNSSLLAGATPPRVTAVPRSTEMPANATSELERKVFRDRKIYSMTLNVPNLNSRGGSWVMHFAEAKDTENKGDLVAPVATRAVDPGYPLELMRQNVQGTVMLSAVIRSDGSVGEVHILRGVDDRLDEYASAALSRWQFRPATRNGDPVALQAVVMIPFRPTRGAGF